jgi:signal transduction histidine kinase
MVVAIGKVTGRMQTLMQRVSDPNASVDPEITPLDLVEMLQSTIRERLWPEAIKLEYELVTLPAVAGDADLLRGVFENLYDNAVQAMQGQGRLSIAAIESTDEQGQPCIEVSVADEGCGISEEFIHQHLFRLFATSKSNGLGVGLYLSRRVVLAHGGSIAAESEGTGQGSTFIVRLPLWRNNTENQAEGLSLHYS